MSKAKVRSPTHIIQSADHLKDADRRREGGLRMVQNVLLVWLDDNSDCRDSIDHLHSIVNTVKTFTDFEECVDFLGDVADEKVCMIISESLAQQIVPLVHNMPQVYSIFILCSNQKYHVEWAKQWSKIKSVSTEIEPISKAVKQAAQQCEQNAIPYSIINLGDGDVAKIKDQLDPSFMYTQIMKETFFTIDFQQKHIDDFLQHCREVFADNKTKLKYVDKLAHEYNKDASILWYTADSFLYSMLNRALRMMDSSRMIKLGFFINDLHREIEQLHQEQFNSHSSKENFTVYRGQGLDKEAFEKMVTNKGGLFSFNNFLSTSKNHSTALFFADCASYDAQLVGVLFIMNIDPARSSTPFASVFDRGSFGNAEEEVLFSMHSVFRIGDITPIDGYPRLVQVHMNLASENDNDLRDLIDCIRKETFPDEEGWYRLGSVLWKMGEYAQAEQVYAIILTQETNENSQASIYHQLAVMKHEQGEYAQAIEYSNKSIEVREKQIPQNDLSLASSYNNIGLVYDCMSDYPQALSFHEKALTIREQSLSPTHSDLAASYSNIGLVYYNMVDYPKALSFHEKALAIREKVLPPTHPHLAASYNNIGSVHEGIGDYPKALSSHEKALEIKQKALPLTHPELANSYANIGLLYYNMGDYPKAVSSYKKALEIREQSLPPTHPDLAASYNNIGLVCKSMGDHAEALSSYEKTLKIFHQSLPLNHPHLAISYDNIGGVYEIMGDCSKALSFFEIALGIREQSLPPIHPDLAASHNNIGLVYHRMDNFSKALSSYEKALVIFEQSHPPILADLAVSYNNIGGMHEKLGDYAKALSFHEKALAIRQQSLSPTHPDLATSYYNIGLVYYRMGDYPKALFFHQKAVVNRQQSLPPNHPNLAASYSNIGLVYLTMGDISNALASFDKLLAIQQEPLASTQSELAPLYSSIGLIYYSLGDYPKALLSYEKTLLIQKQSLPPIHPDLAASYGNIGDLNESMGDYSKAHSHFERAVDIGEQSPSTNHSDLQKWRNALARLKLKL